MKPDAYYLVDAKSETHRIIAEMFVKRTLAITARQKMMHRLFPESKPKKAGWNVVSWLTMFGDSRMWGIQPPAGTPVHPDWKKQKGTDAWTPRVSTKAGKELHREMQNEEYGVPGTGGFGDAIGVKSVFVDMRVITPSIYTTTDKRYVVGLAKQHKVPANVTRISDIQFEELTTAKRKKSATKTGR